MFDYEIRHMLRMQQSFFFAADEFRTESEREEKKCQSNWRQCVYDTHMEKNLLISKNSYDFFTRVDSKNVFCICNVLTGNMAENWTV